VELVASQVTHATRPKVTCSQKTMRNGLNYSFVVPSWHQRASHHFACALQASTAALFVQVPGLQPSHLFPENYPLFGAIRKHQQSPVFRKAAR
jgi:hypothetical protein